MLARLLYALPVVLPFLAVLAIVFVVEHVLRVRAGSRPYDWTREYAELRDAGNEVSGVRRIHGSGPRRAA